MNALEKANVLVYHRQLLQQPINPAEKLGWNDLIAQQKRFEVLSKLADMSNSIILDAGCGWGHLKPFLDTCFHNFVYLGIDHLPEFITEAHQQCGHYKDTYFQQADFITDSLPHVDYVLASGSLNYQTENLMFPFLMIEKFYRIARRGVAFNLLDEEKFRSNNLLKSYNRFEVLSYCLRLAERAELITGYLEDDFTIMMYKKP